MQLKKSLRQIFPSWRSTKNSKRRNKMLIETPIPVTPAPAPVTPPAPVTAPAPVTPPAPVTAPETSDQKHMVTKERLDQQISKTRELETTLSSLQEEVKKISTLTESLSKKETENLQLKFANRYNIPEELVPAIVGTNKEEMENMAKIIQKNMKPSTPGIPPTPAGSSDPVDPTNPDYIRKIQDPAKRNEAWANLMKSKFAK